MVGSAPRRLLITTGLAIYSRRTEDAIAAKVMDRALKERVIGAVVLVVIAVLVVPVFLNGPSTDAEIVSEPVTLPGQDGQSRKRQTIVLERDRDQPVPTSARQGTAAPAAAAPSASDEATKKVSTSEQRAEAEPETVAETPPGKKPASASPREESAAPASAARTPPDSESTTGMWAVQLGSFSNKSNAERLAADLRDKGYAAFLSQLRTASGELHRVRIGPQKDRDSAEVVAAKLLKDGQKGQVVPHP